jgi:aryl-alcohol dehydrogenase-like predicted oxidoreductase
VSEQTHYNLRVRKPELEVIPACEHYGLGLIPWSPLAGGALAGKPEGDGGRRTEGWTAEAIAKDRARLEEWEELCRELGEKPADVALAWLLHQPVVTAPIIGPRTLAQLDGSVRALEIELGRETLAKIDDLFPGHKTAPEDYAW